MTQQEDNETPRVYIGGSFRVKDPQRLAAHPKQVGAFSANFVAYPTNHNWFTGFRTVLNPRQDRCSP